MKFRNIYVVNSLKEDTTINFSSMKKAEKWIENYNTRLFSKSTKSDLYITKRILF